MRVSFYLRAAAERRSRRNRRRKRKKKKKDEEIHKKEGRGRGEGIKFLLDSVMTVVLRGCVCVLSIMKTVEICDRNT